MNCIQDDLEKARNLKLLLFLYEKISGLKINFDKSEIVVINGDHEVSSNATRISLLVKWGPSP